MAKLDGLTLVVGLAVIAVALSVVFPGALQSIRGEEPEPTLSEVVAEACNDPSNALTWGPLAYKWSPGTSMSSVNIRYYLNDGIGTSTTSGSTKTVADGDKISGIYGYGTTKDTTYYAQRFDIEAPCKPFETKTFVDDKGKSVKTTYELIPNGTITWNNFAADTGNKDDGRGSTNETIGTAESGEWDLALTTSDKYGISSQGGKFMVVVEFNKTMYDESSVTLNGKSGVQVPQSYSVLATDDYALGWEFPACPDPSTEARRCDVDLGRLYIKADTTRNPTGGNANVGSIGLGDLVACVLDQNYGKHTITDEIIGPAYVDNEGTALGLKGALGECQYLRVN